MKLKYLKKLILITNCLLLSSISFSVYASTQNDFTQADKKLSTEGKHFYHESLRLLNNTQEVERVLNNFENTLYQAHQTTQHLKTLNKHISTIKSALSVAEAIPETRDQAIELKENLDTVQKPVIKAMNTMEKIDNKIIPLRNATKKAQEMSAKLVVDETKFRNGGINFLTKVEKLAHCVSKKESIIVLNDFRNGYSKVDKELKTFNDSYDKVKKAPERAIKQITDQIDEIKALEKPLLKLDNELKPLYSALKKLKNVLDKKISVKIPYPCGVKICNTDIGVRYPCGSLFHPKICHKSVPVPCGIKRCNLGFSISVATVLKGANAIEREIEDATSKVIYEGMKKIGLGSVINDLKNEAKKLLRPVLKELHLDINVKLPKLTIGLNIKMLEVATVDLVQFEKELKKLELLLGSIKKPSIDFTKFQCK